MAKDFVQGSLFKDDSQDSYSLPKGKIIRLAFDAGVDNCFDYVLPEELGEVGLGQRVSAPFGRGNKTKTGFCVEVDIEPETEKEIRYKKISKVIDDSPLLTDNLIELAKWISEYYICPLGQVLSSMVPSAVKKGVGAAKERLIYLDMDPADFEDSIDGLKKGTKQILIMRSLCSVDAFGRDNAIPEKELLKIASSTTAPLKKLIEKNLVKIRTEVVYKSLPAVPDKFLTKSKEVVLNEYQVAAIDYVVSEINAEKFGVSLLHGVTDSGKTEVYIRSIEAVIAKGKSAIILLPEIALTAQTVQRFASRFERIAVMHSGLTAAQRNSQWQKIRSGGADVVIGARSAIFAPLTNLGLVVVDEEHEPSYKQDTVPRYNGRDVAIKRVHLDMAHCILGSATPSLESVLNCQTRKYFKLLEMPKRVMDLPLPEMQLVDMKNEPQGKMPHLISSKLENRLQGVLSRKEQAILLLNRRGYSNYIYCPKCKHAVNCRNCDVTLTFHRSKQLEQQSKKRPGFASQYNARGYAICHYCMSKTLVPDKCPLCNTKMIMIGLGSQKLEEELVKKFPDAKIARIDSDSMQSGDYYTLLEDFAEGRIDVLAGTQMLAKGLHFPNVTLVGVISADTSLTLPDFRANERTFQLLNQVSGRTGRGDKPGRVVIQSYLCDQPAIKFAMDNDFKAFCDSELEIRKMCNLPPYGRMALVHLRDEDFEKLQRASTATENLIQEIIAQYSLDIHVRGPMPSTIERMHRYYRMQIITQAKDAATLGKLFAVLRRVDSVKPVVRTVIDVDPVNLF